MTIARQNLATMQERADKASAEFLEATKAVADTFAKNQRLLTEAINKMNDRMSRESTSMARDLGHVPI